MLLSLDQGAALSMERQLQEPQGIEEVAEAQGSVNRLDAELS